MPAIDKRKAVQAALAYTQQRRFDKAIAEYKNALSVDPQDLTICKKLGDLYAQTGAIQEAIATYMKLGDLFRADGLAVKAIAIYKMVLNLDPKNMQIYLACADLYAEQGLVGEAKIQYMTVAEQYTREGETRMALEVFEKIANLDPTNFGIAARVGEMYEKEKLIDAAVSHYVAAAKAAARAGHSREAGDLYARALRLQPRGFEALLGLGRMHMDAGNFREAVPALEGAAETAPENPIPLGLLGQCYRQMASPEKAVATLQRAVEADPAATDARIELARCLLEIGRNNEAWDEFAAATDQLLEEGRGEEALEILQGLLGEGEGGAPLLTRLAAIHERLGRDEEAQSMRRRLAEQYEHEGRRAEAVAVYRGLLELQPEDPILLARLEALGSGVEPAVAVAPPEPETPAEVPEPAAPRVIPIAAAAEPAADVEMEVLGEGEAGMGLFAAEALEGATPVALEDDAAEVAEQLAEADVYLKYGLVEKAAERLRETLAEFPGNVATRSRLRRLLQDEGQTAEATAESLALADLLAARGQVELAAQELEALRRADPENPEVRNRLGRLLGGRAEPPAQAVSQIAAEPPPAEPPVSPPAPPPGPAEAETVAPLMVLPVVQADEGSAPELAPAEAEAEESFDLSSLLSPGGDQGLAGVPPSDAEEEAEAYQLDFGGEAEDAAPEPVRLDLGGEAAPEDLSLDLREAVGQDTAQALRIGADEGIGDETPALTLDLGGIAEDLEEAEFFRTQGMHREAEALYRRILERDPENAGARAGLSALSPQPAVAEVLAEDPFDLDVTVAELEPAPATEEPPDVGGLDLEEAFGDLPPEPVAAASAEPVPSVAPPPEPPPIEDVPPESWIPGPGPFVLEEAGDLDMAPGSVAPPAEASGPGIDLLDLDLPSAQEAPAGPVDLASLDAIDVVPPAASPEPPAPPAEAEVTPLPSTAGGEPDAPPPAWRVAVEEPAPRQEETPPPSASPRRIGPAEEIPVFRVAKPADEPALGGFVDLGGEIQREMDVASRGPVGSAEGAALLDELLEEFQKGVRQHLDVEDFETHYNLGIAYREMDLFDEAIEEFRLAARDPARRLTCSGLIALCLLAKGRAEPAIDELTRALALPGYTPEQYHGLRYDLATAFEAAGQESLALQLLEALAATAPTFRDTAGRLAALRDRKAKAAQPAAAAVPGADRGGTEAGEEIPPRGAGPSRPAPAPAETADETPPAAPTKPPARPRRDKISFV